MKTQAKKFKKKEKETPLTLTVTPYFSTISSSLFLSGRIPWIEESGGRQSMGLQRVGQDWSDLAAEGNH